MARPREVVIDWDLFESYCAHNCTKEEILTYLNAGDRRCSESTLDQRCKERYDACFQEVLKKKAVLGRLNMKMSIHRKLMEHLESGNVTVAIWLSKQYLGFRDQPAEAKDHNVQIVYNRPK